MLNDYPFDRLRSLLQDIDPPAGLTPINLSIGEPQARVPDFVPKIIAQHDDSWGRYSSLHGSPNFKPSLQQWIKKRYAIPDNAIANESLMPLSGTREGLFLAACHCVAEKRQTGIAQPVVIYPNPFYHVYHAGALVNNAFAETYDATKNIIPQLEKLCALHHQKIALVYVCNPNNPTSDVLSIQEIKAILGLARSYNFTVLFDECYSEIYMHTPPASAFEALIDEPENHHFWIVNSLSKRSSVPGLRCGFIYGPSNDMKAFARLRSHAAAIPPIAVTEAAAHLWADEEHVISARKHYQSLHELAVSILGLYPGFKPINAGFFLWLNVGDGVAMSKHLWSQAALRTLPGEFMACTSRDNAQIPGKEFIRIALIHDFQTTKQALERMAHLLLD